MFNVSLNLSRSAIGGALTGAAAAATLYGIPSIFRRLTREAIVVSGGAARFGVPTQFASPIFYSVVYEDKKRLGYFDHHILAKFNTEKEAGDYAAKLNSTLRTVARIAAVTLVVAALAGYAVHQFSIMVPTSPLIPLLEKIGSII